MTTRLLPDQLGNAAKRVRDQTVPPWKRWKRMSRHARAIRFIETYCHVVKGHHAGKLIRLGTFQKEFLEETLAERPPVEVGILETPRGNGKSSGGGAIATWAAFDDDDTGAPQVPVIATTVSQAVRSCYGSAVAMVEMEPELANRSLIYTGIGTRRVYVPFNRGELFPISSDVDGLQGLDPSVALADEMGFLSEGSWNALRLAAGKRPRSLTIGVGTPGVNKTNALWMLRSRIRERGRIPGVVFHEYATPLGYDLADREGWQIGNPAMRGSGRRRFLRESALVTDLELVPEASFRVFRLGQWAEGVDSWLGAKGAAIWSGLADPAVPLLEAPTWVGIDVGLQRDSTVVAYVQRRPDMTWHVWAKAWLPTSGEAVDVTDAMGFIRDLGRLYRVESVAYDPRFFDVPAKMLGDEGIRMKKVDQSVQRMTVVCGGLLEAIKRRELHHDGDPLLTTHMLNAKARINERGFTLAKLKSSGRIDGAIATGLALDQAIHHRKRERPRSVMT